MSSPASETAQSVGQDPSSDSSTGQTTSPESQLQAADQNISEQTTGEQKLEIPLNVQTESNDPSIETKTLIESKVTSTDKMESKTDPDSKMPGVNQIDCVLEKKVQVEDHKKEIEKTSENTACTSNIEENMNDSTKASK